MQRPLNTVSPQGMMGNSPNHQISPSGTPRLGSPQQNIVPNMRPPHGDMRMRFARPTGKDMRPPMRNPGYPPQQQRMMVGIRQPVSPGGNFHQQPVPVRSPQPMMQRRPSGSGSVPSPITDRPVTPQTPRMTAPSPQHDNNSQDQFQMPQQQMMMQQGHGGGNGQMAPHEDGWSSKPKIGLKGGQWCRFKRGWGPFIGLKGGSPIFTNSTGATTNTSTSASTASSVESTLLTQMRPVPSVSSVPAQQPTTVPAPTITNVQKLPPSSVHQANIGVPGAYNPSRTTPNVSLQHQLIPSGYSASSLTVTAVPFTVEYLSYAGFRRTAHAAHDGR